MRKWDEAYNAYVDASKARPDKPDDVKILNLICRLLLMEVGSSKKEMSDECCLLLVETRVLSCEQAHLYRCS